MIRRKEVQDLKLGMKGCFYLQWFPISAALMPGPNKSLQERQESPPHNPEGDAPLEDGRRPQGRSRAQLQYFKIVRACKGALSFSSTFNTLKRLFFLSRLL